ncbi:MAG: redoxin domain-containing protein, partial [Candidatus Hinthialibacter sp.]
MIRIGLPAPEFTVEAVDNKQFKTISLSDYKGKWVCLFFYPLDFTFVCPTEIVEFSRKSADFAARDCAVIGGST